MTFASGVGQGLARIVFGGALVWAGAAVAQSPLGDLPAAAQARLPEVAELTQRLTDRPGAAIRVIVEFAPPALPDGIQSGTAQGDAAQIAGVAAVQDRILGRVLGTAADGAQADAGLGLRRLTYSPMLALNADAALIAALASDPEVLRIVIDRPVPPALTTSLPLIGMPAAYAAGATGEGQMVAVLDSGARPTHEFLSSRITAGACFNSNAPDQGATSRCPGGVTQAFTIASGDDCTGANISGCGHGTHVAGTAAGFNTALQAGEPAHGVARDARLMSINVFSLIAGAQCGELEPGFTQCIQSFPSDQIAALEYIYGQRTSLSFAAVNMSLGGGEFASPCPDDELRPIVQQLTNAGIAVIVAAGNESRDAAVGAPACIPEAITVASTTRDDQRSDFSNWGNQIDIAAPGSDIVASGVSGTSNSNYRSESGTSMAAPHVAGAFAAIRSVRPDATVAQILAALQETGTPVTAVGVTVRRINVDQALTRLGGPVNNAFASRTVISQPGTVTGTNAGATREAGEPALVGSTTHTTSVWWSFTPAQSGQVTIDTVGSGFDTVLGVYTGGAVNALTPVVENDDIGGGNLRSQVQFQAAAGTAYQIVVAGKAGVSGAITLNLALTPGSAAPTQTALTGPAAVNHGAQASYTATVTSGAGTPAGTVSFRRAGMQFATGVLNGQGVATASSTAFPPGAQAITAVYLGNANFQTSTSVQVTTTVTIATTTTLAGPATGQTGQTLTYTATVAAAAGAPGGTVSFRRGGIEFATGALNGQGVATGGGSFPAGTHQITAHYLGVAGFAPSVSAARSVTVSQGAAGPLEFVGGGTVFEFTPACAAGGWANTPHPARLRYGPGEVNGMPSQVGVLFPSGAEHLQTWQPLAQSTLNYDALGRQMWTLFVLQQPFPRMTPVQRRITQPANGTDIAQATEVMLRLRVSGFGGIPGCGATVAGVLRRGE